MDLWIIYNNSFDSLADNPAKRMLREAAKHQIQAELKFDSYFSILENKLYYKKEECTLPKIVFLRGQDISLMEYLEAHGVRTINSSFTIKAARDKLYTHRLVATLEIPQIKTLEAALYSYDEAVGFLGLPFVLKYRFGCQGRGVYLIHNKNEYQGALKNIDINDFIIQKYIKTSYGKDIRTYIVGDKVIGACLRENEASFMSNLHQGGKSYNYELTTELIESSLKIKKALKGDIISVDYVIGDNGLLFCEANTNAGFASFAYLGYDMRALFMDYIKGLLN